MIIGIVLMAAIFAVSFFAIAGHGMASRDHRMRILLSLTALVVMLAGVFLYGILGEIGRSDAPLSARKNEVESLRAAQNQNRAAAEAALTQAQRQADAAPDDIETLLALAEAAARAGESQTEIAALEKIIARDENPAVMALLAEAFSREAEGIITPKALEWIDRALAAEPREVRARYLKGLALSQSGDDDAALRIWVPLAAEVAGTPLFPAIAEAVIYAAERLGHDAEEIARELQLLERNLTRGN